MNVTLSKEDLVLKIEDVSLESLDDVIGTMAASLFAMIGANKAATNYKEADKDSDSAYVDKMVKHLLGIDDDAGSNIEEHKAYVNKKFDEATASGAFPYEYVAENGSFGLMVSGLQLTRTQAESSIKEKLGYKATSIRGDFKVEADDIPLPDAKPRKGRPRK